MTAFKGTPGPWVADGAVVESFDAPTTPDICSTLREGWVWQIGERVPTREVAFANARLIAAAPDLLAALLRYQRENGLHHDGDFETYEFAAVAIAKALGEPL